MKVFVIAAFAVLCSVQCFAQNAYITNTVSRSVSVIDTTTDSVTATIAIGGFPFGVAITPNGKKVYISNTESKAISVIDATTNKIVATIPAPNSFGIAASQDGKRVYAANLSDSSVSVIDTSTDTLIDVISVGVSPYDLVVANKKVYITNCTSQCFDKVPGVLTVVDTATDDIIGKIPVFPDTNLPTVTANHDGSRVYVTDEIGQNVPVIDTATDTVIANIPVSNSISAAVSADGTRVYIPNFMERLAVVDAATNMLIANLNLASGLLFGVSVTPDSSKIFVVNSDDNSVVVIDAATDSVIANIPVGTEPAALGAFIQPSPPFAGTPGASNCIGKSISALAKQYNGLNSAAMALGFSSVKDLQNAVIAFCRS